MSGTVLVVDMLNDFVDGAFGNPLAKEIIGPIATLVDAARSDPDWHVVYANDAHQPGDFEFRAFPPHSLSGTHAAEVVADLAPGPDDLVVTKRCYSAFTFTDLALTLHVLGVDRVVIVGQQTDCGVRHTAYDAFTQGLAITVASDGTAVSGPMSEEPAETRQARALDYLRRYYGARVTTAAHALI
ncbi:MAG TPA: isochorismatase family cysteine hydrolase [Acidimicrobiales bacterium]|nr:isochorismatase family cysteine hydrolase [Acidimicrobiales bacterium]